MGRRAVHLGGGDVAETRPLEVAGGCSQGIQPRWWGRPWCRRHRAARVGSRIARRRRAQQSLRQSPGSCLRDSTSGLASRVSREKSQLAV